MNEIIEVLVSKIAMLEKRIDYLETVELIGEWTDYTSSSTITGWSSTTIEEIYYKIIGKLMLITFRITGTSDDTVATFTIPETVSNDPASANIGFNAIFVEDNGVDGIGFVYAERNTSNIHCIPDESASAWTNSGTKKINGQLWFQIQ